MVLGCRPIFGPVCSLPVLLVWAASYQYWMTVGPRTSMPLKYESYLFLVWKLSIVCSIKGNYPRYFINWTTSGESPVGSSAQVSQTHIF